MTPEKRQNGRSACQPREMARYRALARDWPVPRRIGRYTPGGFSVGVVIRRGVRLVAFAAGRGRLCERAAACPDPVRARARGLGTLTGSPMSSRLFTSSRKVPYGLMFDQYKAVNHACPPSCPLPFAGSAKRSGRLPESGVSEGMAATLNLGSPIRVQGHDHEHQRSRITAAVLDQLGS
jgi:hypothetical protein